ncbi:hypothetical protein RCOM_1449900 [Ricinus communis]|uniref:Uncharacterized protein n=1 Tax=Ricinus communis TaxID=3988 RepID=B9RHC2_RICCO|nr:hypothetical protein RCOM_1449900 [Ricinus communis]
MGSLKLKEILENPDEILVLLKLIRAVKDAERKIPKEPNHLGFCYFILNKISHSFALVIQGHQPMLRDAF